MSEDADRARSENELSWLGRIIAGPYMISLNPNCICRDEPDSPVGNRVFVIRPKEGLPATLPGCPKFA